MSENIHPLNPEYPLINGLHETRIIGRAIRERWPIREGAREAIINNQIDTALDENVEIQHRQKAAQIVLTADKINIEAGRQIDVPQPDPVVTIEQPSQLTVEQAVDEPKQVQSISRDAGPGQPGQSFSTHSDQEISALSGKLADLVAALEEESASTAGSPSSNGHLA